MDKYIGKFLDNRYEILQVIGTGGMAVVYKAMCHRLNRLVAIKILKDEFAKDEEFRNRFHTESHAVAMLSHPNIVAVYDVSRSTSVEYIVMELIDGITLKQYMERKGVMNWKESTHFVSQILKALDHAHSKGIIHRDIKPHNIMVLRDGTIKVTDFGIARFAAEQRTLTNEALGSVHYISPEQARGGKLDARADIYSTGVVLYEMLTGRLPYEGDSPVAIAIQHINSMPLQPREICADIPETIEKITMRAMCGDLNGRYASASEMLGDIETFRKNPKIVIDFSERDLPLEPITLPKRKPQPKKIIEDEWEEDMDKPKSKRSKIMSYLIVLAVVILFAMGLWAILSSALGGGGKNIEVPNLVGADIAEVVEDSKYENFEIVESGKEYSAEYDEGEIIRQDPKAGEEVKRNGKISVIVSRGAKIVKVPDVVNKSENQARIELETKSSLVMEIEYEEDDEVLEGYVIRTYPKANSEVSEGETITVYISKSEEKTLKMPELIGLSKESAEKTLEEANLKLGTVYTEDSDKKEGTVIKQSIEVDTEIEEGTEVDITISVKKGSDPIDDPKPPVENPDPPKTEDPKPPVVSSKSMTIPIKLPASPDSLKVRVTVDNKEAYNNTHSASEGTVNVTITGSGTVSVKVYINDALYYDLTKEF